MELPPPPIIPSTEESKPPKPPKKSGPRDPSSGIILPNFVELGIVNTDDQELIRNTLSIKNKNKLSISPLHLSVRLKYPRLTRWLLDQGVDVNSKTSFSKETPLHFAANTSSLNPDTEATIIEIINILLTHRSINMYSENDEFKTPAQVLLKFSNISYPILDYFLKFIDINHHNSKGFTLLQNAYDKKDIDLILFLKERGADGSNIECSDIIIRELLVKPYEIHLPNIYTFSGHGCDTGDEKKVPENCTYVTLAVCGDLVYMKYNWSALLVQCYERGYLLDPTRYKEEIFTILGRPIQIYQPNETYSDVEYTVPHLFTAGDNCPEGYNSTTAPFSCVYLSQVSGLHTIDQLNPFSFDIQTGDAYTFENLEITPIEPNPSATVFDKIYGKSLLPSTPFNFEGSTPKEKYDNIPHGKIKQSTLFQLYPGIYYNIVCRNPCDSAAIPKVTKRRSKSIANRPHVFVSEMEKSFNSTEESSITHLQSLIDNPSILFVEEYPGHFDKVVGDSKLNWKDRETTTRIIQRTMGGTRKKNKRIKKSRKLKFLKYK